MACVEVAAAALANAAKAAGGTILVSDITGNATIAALADDTQAHAAAEAARAGSAHAFITADTEDADNTYAAAAEAKVHIVHACFGCCSVHVVCGFYIR